MWNNNKYKVVKDLTGKNYNQKVEIRKKYLKINPGADVQIRGNELVRYN